MPSPSMPPDEAAADVAPDETEVGAGPIPPALLGLSVAGLTRRRIAWLAAVLVSAWVVIIFGRQVGEASAASARADALAAEIETAQADLAALRLELDLVSRPTFVEFAARADRLGSDREKAFSLAPDAPELGDEAPGSAARAVGAEERQRSPFEAWLSLLFGPAD